jgi:predicted acyltransferase
MCGQAMTTPSALERFDVSTSFATSVSPAASPARVASIDIFRGLTILVMIFVNDLSSVHGLPWWTYHAHAEQDAMTYVDMVFPFFLFIVGMSMPLAVTQRLKRNASMVSLWLHVLSRSAGLVVLGLILANAEKADSVRMGLNANMWALLGLTGAVLFGNRLYFAGCAWPGWRCLCSPLPSSGGPLALIPVYGSMAPIPRFWG